MDPDRYQMRDIKRRQAALEKNHDYRTATLTRIVADLRETRGALAGLSLIQEEHADFMRMLQVRLADLEELIGEDPIPHPRTLRRAKDTPH